MSNQVNNIQELIFNNTDQYNNFRALLLVLRLLHTAKLLTIIIDKKINKKIEARIMNDQYDLQKNTRTREAILDLKITIKKQIERHKFIGYL